MPAAGKENARKRNAPAAAGARDVITVEVVDGPAKGQVFTKQVRRAPRTRRRGRPARGSPARGVAVARSARVCSPRVSCAEALPTRSRRMSRASPRVRGTPLTVPSPLLFLPPLAQLNKLTIGRTRTSHVYVKDPAVSQKHGAFVWTAGRWTIVDSDPPTAPP